MSATPSATCTVPGGTAGADAQGTGPSRAQSTFTVPGSSWKRRIARRTRSGTSRRRQQVAVQVGRGHVGEHGPPGADPLAADVRTPARGRPAPRCRRPRASQPDLAAAGLAAGGPGRWVSLPAPPSGTGKPTVWPSMRHQQRHQARPGCVERDVRVPGVAGEQQPRTRRRRTARGRARRPGVSRCGRSRARPPDGAARAGTRPAPHRREGAEQGARPAASPMTSHSAHSSSQASPSPGWPASASGGRHLAVPVQQRPAAVGQGVPEHGGGVPPDEPVLLEAERTDRRRGRRERVERAERVVHEVGVHVLGTGARRPRASAGPRARATDQPASARWLAATRPLGPEPTTTAS